MSQIEEEQNQSNEASLNVRTFNVEFREKTDRFIIKINPAITTIKKYHLTELINTIDDALYTIRASYVMKDAYLELTGLLEQNNYTYITILQDDAQLQLALADNGKQLCQRDPYLIEVERKLTVVSLNFLFKPEIIDIVKTIKGRFWSKDDGKWYVPINEIERLRNKIKNYNPKYKFEDVLSPYQLEQAALLETQQVL
jgi:hypothetical protein